METKGSKENSTRQQETKTRSKTRSGSSLSVLMITSEAAPYVKVRERGDVLGTLPVRLAEIGVDVSVIMPLYREVSLRGYTPEPTGVQFSVHHAGTDRDCEIYSIKANGVNYYFLDEPDFFDREEVYGPPGSEYPDNAERYSFLARASIYAVDAMGLKPQVIHCHDWHTALAPLYLKYDKAPSQLFSVPVVLTIHNLAYQGHYGSQILPAIGLPAEVYTDGTIQYAGRLNFLKGGILSSDLVSTVSPSYAREITTTEYGWGLDDLLRGIETGVKGILNGLDYDSWNPLIDTALVAPFSAADPSGRRINREH